jgi:hypothetical protein
MVSASMPVQCTTSRRAMSAGVKRTGAHPSHAVAARGASASAASAFATVGVDKLGVASSMIFVSFNVAAHVAAKPVPVRRKRTCASVIALAVGRFLVSLEFFDWMARDARS